MSFPSPPVAAFHAIVDIKTFSELQFQSEFGGIQCSEVISECLTKTDLGTRITTCNPIICSPFSLPLDIVWL